MPPSKCSAHDRVIRQQLEAGKTLADIARDLRLPRKTLSDYVNRPVHGFKPAYATDRAARPGTVTPTGQVTEVEVLRERVRELQTATTKDRKEEVQRDRVASAVEKALATVRPSPAIWNASPVLIPRDGEERHHRMVVLLSDFHGGERVDPAVLNGLNAYSWEIMEARVEETIAAILSHVKNAPALTGIDIGYLGDMNSGSNHLELALTNEFGLAEQGVKMGYLMGQIVERLVPYFLSVNVFCVEGNHPRLTVKPQSKSPEENMDWVSAVIAREYLRDYPTVEQFVIGKGSLLWKVAGQTVYVFHGDGVRSNMPGVPWGGMARRMNEIKRTYASQGIHIDQAYYGHFHTAHALIDQGLFGNGSLKGPDEYSMKNFGGGSAPAQLVLTYDEKAERLSNIGLITPTAGYTS